MSEYSKRIRSPGSIPGLPPKNHGVMYWILFVVISMDVYLSIGLWLISKLEF